MSDITLDDHGPEVSRRDYVEGALGDDIGSPTQIAIHVARIDIISLIGVSCVTFQLNAIMVEGQGLRAPILMAVYCSLGLHLG